MFLQFEYYSSKVTTEKNLKLFISSITGNAYDPRESGGYHGNLTIHKGKVYKDYHEAIEAIKKYNSGWYSDHIVMYYDISAKGRAKVTEWEKKRDYYILSLCFVILNFFIYSSLWLLWAAQAFLGGYIILAII